MNMDVRTHVADKIVERLRADASQVSKVREDPIDALEALANEVATSLPSHRPWIYGVAVAALSTVALTAALGSIVLVLYDKSTPETLIALGSAAVGALVGLFAPTPSR